MSEEFQPTQAQIQGLNVTTTEMVMGQAVLLAENAYELLVSPSEVNDYNADAANKFYKKNKNRRKWVKFHIAEFLPMARYLLNQMLNLPDDQCPAYVKETIFLDLQKEASLPKNGQSVVKKDKSIFAVSSASGLILPN
jgi:hypothetical protein